MHSKKLMPVDSIPVERQQLTNDEMDFNLIHQPIPIEPNQTMGTFAFASSASWQKHVNDTMSDKTFCFQQEEFSKFMTLDVHKNIIGRVQVKKGTINPNDEFKLT